MILYMLLDQRRKTDDRIHRCADIMGHIGKKQIFGIISRIGFVQRIF